MKRVLGLTAMLGLLCTLSRPALSEEKPADDAPSPMVKADTPVVIDGALDDEVWKKAAVVRGDYINNKKGVLSDEQHLNIKYAWDEHYLYIGYETFDKNLVAKGTGIKEGPENNKREGLEIWSSDPKAKIDVVEFFISFGDERFFWEIHHNAANQFNDVWCAVPDPATPIAKSSLAPYGIIFGNQEFIQDDGGYTVAMAVKMKPKADGGPSTVNNPDDVDTGYTAELRLPWGGLGAPEAAKPKKKDETGWKIEGQKMMILAVVQDGDLKERYHHSAPNKTGDWFHKTAALWPKYTLAKPVAQAEPAHKPAGLNIDELSTPDLAAEIFRRIDNHENAGELIHPAADRGMSAARACAAGLNAENPQRHEILYDIIAMASRCRRSNRELLRLYDPPAYKMFYTAEGAEDQKAFAFVLGTEKWPSFAPEALINAAPRPLLEWMKAQAASEKPDLEKLYLVWQHWGLDILYRRERQHVEDVRAAIEAFSRNQRISGDPVALAALIRFAGEAGAAGCADLASRELTNSSASVRAEAALALQRFGGGKAPAAILALAEKETDSNVLLRMAEALGAWPEDKDAGAAAFALFQRCELPEVRRAILFSCAKAAWPQRTALILKSFQVPENGVLGTALQAVAAQAEPEIKEKTLALMSVYKTPPAPLIDALGGLKDPRAAPYLVDALKQSTNLSIRLKLILALEKVGGSATQTALLEQLNDTSNALFAQQLAGVAGRMTLPGAEDVLIALAKDLTAPLPVRVQCLWSLGGYHSEKVRSALKEMDAQAEKLFGAADSTDLDASVYEKVEQARMLLKMALLQQGGNSGEAAGEAASLYARGTPTTKLSMLMLLSHLKLDHAVIAEGLESPDFAVMLAAVHAAGAAQPRKYHKQLIALERAPHIAAMMETGLDLNDLDDVLRVAIAAGK